MDLKTFRVRMYKGIIDSGWIDVNSLTVFVGKNESGKTSLLKALHKLNPYNSESQGTAPESYDISREWPRLRLEDRNEDYIVCRAKFQFSSQEKSELAKIANREIFPDIVEVSRNYAGQLKVKFEEEIFPDEHGTHEVDSAFSILPSVQEHFGELFKESVQVCLKQAKDLAYKGQFAELRTLTARHEQLLIDSLSPTEPPHQIETDFIYQYLSNLEHLAQELEQFSSPQSRINEYIINHLPTFIYMSDYRIFNGSTRLDEIQTRQDANNLTEEDRTFLSLLDLSGLDLDTLVSVGTREYRDS